MSIFQLYAFRVTIVKNFIKLSLTLLLFFLFLFLSQSLTFAAAPSNGAWVTVGNMASRRITFASTLLQNGKVLIAGGRPSRYEPLISYTELYDPTTQTWSTTGNLNTPRMTNPAVSFPFMVTLQNGKVLDRRRLRYR